jgi:hypothetical protein
MFSRIHKGELPALVAISCLFLLLTSLPYLVGYAVQDQARVFSGAVLDRQDYAVHLASMHMGARGTWQYHMEFTTEEHPGAYVKLTYIFLGHVATWLGISIPATYQLARLFSGLLACLAIYWLITEIFPHGIVRWMAFGLVLFGAGLGWLQLLLHWSPQPGVSPIDFWLIDAYIFQGEMAFPHFSMVTALLALMAGTFLRARQARAGLWAGVALFAVISQFIQPFAPLTIDLAMTSIVGLDMFRRRKLPTKELLGLGIVAIAQVPLLVYNLLVFSSNLVWANFSAQNITLSPTPVYYLLGFGFVWLFVLPGLWLAVRSVWWEDQNAGIDIGINRDGLLLAAFWCGIALLLAYLPWNLQRRFMHAYMLPLGLLAGAGFAWLLSIGTRRSWQRWLQKYQGSVALSFVLLNALSSLYLCLGYSLFVAERTPTLFDPVGQVQAVDWLSQHAQPGEAVLASETTSQLVVARAGLPVYFGHPIETMNYAIKKNQVAAFFTGEGDQDLLVKNHLRWVITPAGEQDAMLHYSCLQLAYQNSSSQVYRVQP